MVYPLVPTGVRPSPALTSPHGLRLFYRYVPPLLRSSRVWEAYCQVLGLELDALFGTADEVAAQFAIGTATWSLPDWETEHGLPVRDDLTTAERRSTVIAARRGVKDTLDALRAAAEAFQGVEIHLVEDWLANVLYIMFVGVGGVPSNISDFQYVMRRIVPAALDILYVYWFMTWDRWDTRNAGGPYTWDQVDTLNAGGPYTWDQHDVLL